MNATETPLKVVQVEFKEEHRARAAEQYVADMAEVCPSCG